MDGSHRPGEKVQTIYKHYSMRGLKIGVELADLVGDRYNGKRWLRESISLKNKIELEYWNEDSKFYFDTIRKDGSKDSSIRPNTLVLLLTDAVTVRQGPNR